PVHQRLGADRPAHRRRRVHSRSDQDLPHKPSAARDGRTRRARDDSTGDLRMATTHDHFPTDTTGLPDARISEVVDLGDGDRFDLRIAPVAKRVADATVRMLAYNGSIPGPTLKVREGSEVVVDIENRGDTEATV